MTAEKCPNCGATITTDSNKCSYCGSVLSNTVTGGTWTKVKQHLPPVSPTDPGKSIVVLVTNCADGINLKFKDGTLWNVYDHGGSISAYYDFHNTIWKNDILGKRYGKIIPTHWLSFPDINSTNWISVKDRIPNGKGRVDGSSERILVCNKNDYPQSIITADFLYEREVWWTTLLQDEPGSDTFLKYLQLIGCLDLKVQKNDF